MPPITLRRYRSGDAGWLTGMHARLYAREAGFDASFVTAVAEVLAQFADRADPREAGFVPEADGTPAGSIFVTRIDDATAQIRLFLLDPAVRASGLAARMLAEAQDFARAQGHRRMRLWTHESHRAAVRLYTRSGWSEVDRRPIRNYGQDLVVLSLETTL